MKFPTRIFVILMVGAIALIGGLNFSNIWAGDAADVKQAKTEGNLVWYTSMHIGNSQVLLKKFEEKYPFIKATLFRSTSEKVLNKITTEALAGSSTWDVTNLTLFEVEFIKSKGLLQKYDSPENRFFSREYVDRDRQWTDVYDNTLVIAYNKNMVPPRDLPKKWEDLLEKRWKGQVVLDEGDTLWFAIMMQVMGEEKGLRYMRDLAANQTQLREGHNLINVLIAAGEFPLGLTYGHLAEQSMDKGAPMNWVGLQPVPVDLHPIAIGKNAPHPNAARLFYDYLLSEEGQKLIMSFRRIPPRNGMEPEPRRLTQGLKLIPVAPELASKYGKYVSQFDSIFKK